MQEGSEAGGDLEVTSGVSPAGKKKMADSRDSRDNRDEAQGRAKMQPRE